MLSQMGFERRILNGLVWLYRLIVAPGVRESTCDGESAVYIVSLCGA